MLGDLHIDNVADSLTDDEVFVAAALQAGASSLSELAPRLGIHEVAVWRTVVNMRNAASSVAGEEPEAEIVKDSSPASPANPPSPPTNPHIFSSRLGIHRREKSVPSLRGGAEPSRSDLSEQHLYAFRVIACCSACSVAERLPSLSPDFSPGRCRHEAASLSPDSALVPSNQTPTT